MNDEPKLIEVFNFNGDEKRPCFVFIENGKIRLINKVNFPTKEEALDVMGKSTPFYYRQVVKNGKIKYEDC